MRFCLCQPPLRNANTGPLKCVIAGCCFFSFIFTCQCVQTYMKLKLTHTHPQPDTHHITQSPPPRPILGPAVQVLPQTSAVTRFIVSLYLPPPFSFCSLTWRNSTIAHFFLLVPKNSTIVVCFLPSFPSDVVAAAAGLRLQTMAHWEQAPLWVYRLQRRRRRCGQDKKENCSCVASAEIEHIWTTSFPLLNLLLFFKLLWRVFTRRLLSQTAFTWSYVIKHSISPVVVEVTDC